MALPYLFDIFSAMYIDSHCHLDFPDLARDLDGLLERMRENDVSHALCVSVNLEDFPRVRALAETHGNLFASVGVHPDYENLTEPDAAQLAALARHPRVVAIGETGLDYFRPHENKGDRDGRGVREEGDGLEWQRERFRQHIRAARQSAKPLIIHTRSAAADTLRIMAEEGADTVGGVMHCFTESWEVAQQAMEMNFYISFSGIVTFKNAVALKDVARRIRLEKMLIETDSPYLAPVPHRGKTNEPAFVRHVAAEIAALRGIHAGEVGAATSENFFNLFKAA